MSSGIMTPAFEEQFSSEVSQAFQGQSALQGSVRVKNGVIGKTYQFPKIGKGIASLHTPHADITPMSVDYSAAVATLLDYDAADYSDIFQQQKVSFDERRELVMTTASALGRRWDQCALDALDASGTSNTVGVTIGGDNAFNVGKIRRSAAQMNRKGVPSMNRHMAVSATALEQLLGSTQATSSDFMNVQALVSGSIDTFYGFKFHIIEDREEGGLPLSGNNRTIFAWHKDAVGTAVGINMKTNIDWIAEKKSWLIAGAMSCGSVVIDNEGVSSITIDESVSI